MEANLAPKYPRCFIWYKAEGFDVKFGIHAAGGFQIAEITGIHLDNLALIKFNDDGINQNEDFCDLDTFLNWNKGKYKEISLKEFMGECPEGDFGIIRIPMRCDPNGQVIYTLVEDEFSKNRIDYLKSNVENKYNIIRLYGVEGLDNNYYYVNTKSYTIDKENNCIIFEIDPIPPFKMATQIKVSLDAEVTL